MLNDPLRETAERVFNTTRLQFLQSYHFGKKASPNVAMACHAILRHQLFDQLVHALGCPANPLRANYSKVDTDQTVVQNLEKVCDMFAA
jgi:hypothetical protein